MTKLTALVPLLLLSVTACADLDPATLIKRDRVLAAKVTVDGAPDRAWPAAGETATVTFVTASPGATPRFSWLLAACPAATSGGMPVCGGEAFASSQSTGLVPTLQLTVPADIATSAIVVTGAICASGTPSIDAKTATAECSDGSRGDLVSQHIFIATSGVTNHNPDLAGAPFTVAGNSWDPSDGDACDDTMPVIQAGAERVRIGVTFQASDREAFAGDAGEAREDLQLSTFATAGDIAQQRTYVEADDAREQTPVVVEWDAPSAKEVPADGLRVKFAFIVRDMRGGVDAEAREVCVR
jgi:hypothetical protein